MLCTTHNIFNSLWTLKTYLKNETVKYELLSSTYLFPFFMCFISLYVLIFGTYFCFSKRFLFIFVSFFLNFALICKM